MDIPNDLMEKVLKRIHREERFFIIRRVAIFSAIFLACVSAFGPVVSIIFFPAALLMLPQSVKLLVKNYG